MKTQIDKNNDVIDDDNRKVKISPMIWATATVTAVLYCVFTISVGLRMISAGLWETWDSVVLFVLAACFAAHSVNIYLFILRERDE